MSLQFTNGWSVKLLFLHKYELFKVDLSKLGFGGVGGDGWGEGDCKTNDHFSLKHL